MNPLINGIFRKFKDKNALQIITIKMFSVQQNNQKQNKNINKVSVKM